MAVKTAAALKSQFEGTDPADHNDDLVDSAGPAITTTASAAELDKLDGVSVTAEEMDQRALTVRVPLGSADQVYVVSPWAGDVIAVYSAINAALTTGNETLTIKDKDGNTMGSLTLTQVGSAPGDVDSDVSIANADVAVGDTIEIETDGANGTTTTATITILIDIT